MNRAYVLKFGAVIGTVISAVLLITAWSQPWFILSLRQPESSQGLSVAGAVAAPALGAFAFASLALAFALVLAGAFFRVILAVLQIVLAGCSGWSTFSALADSTGAGAAVVTQTTGISGTVSVHEAVVGTGTFVWPFVAVGATFLLVAIGVLVLVTLGLWPASPRRYQPVRLERADDESALTLSDVAAGDWDALTRGDDPTRVAR